MILAGDIGGTKCNLAAYEDAGGALRLISKRRYATREFTSFEELVHRFCRDVAAQAGAGAQTGIIAAGFGVPGTVVEGKLHALHVPWSLDAARLAGSLNLPAECVVLMNDLVATARGLDKLQPEDFHYLNRGRAEPEENKAVFAAGTGLGEAMLYWDGHGYRARPSEGGSADFAPRTDQEIRYLQFLKKRMSRVSCEEIFSGRGFQPIHEFLEPGVRHASFASDPLHSGQEITKNALDGSCPVCVRTVDFWTDAFGAEAGNLALRVLAYGGVFLAGGIAVKILTLLQRSSFCKSFADKGQLAPILANIPIAVVLNEDAPLLGAAHAAMISRGSGFNR